MQICTKCQEITLAVSLQKYVNKAIKIGAYQLVQNISLIISEYPLNTLQYLNMLPLYLGIFRPHLPEV